MKFDQGSALLATDDDAKIPLNDPSVIVTNAAGSVYRSDDVPFFVEFNLTNGPTNYCFYTRSMEPVFPLSFGSLNLGSSNYFDIIEDEHLLELINAGGANVKIVKSIDTQNSNGSVPGATLRGLKPASLVLVGGAGSITCVHERGHSCGLEHRGHTNNPGNIYDGVMGYPSAIYSGDEVNRFERETMNGYYHHEKHRHFSSSDPHFVELFQRKFIESTF
jgi:hypothetical protein